jgi:hypothetical protein
MKKKPLLTRPEHKYRGHVGGPSGPCESVAHATSAPAPAWLGPGDPLPSGALYVDIREAYERENAPEDILALPHFPRERWGEIPGELQQRPLVLCCAAGVRTRHCLELLGHPPGVWAWTGSIYNRPAGEGRSPQ